MKKTNLASKAGLHYNVCLRYLQILDSLEWVELNCEVSITAIGKGVYAKLLDVSEARASTTGDDNACTSNPEVKSIEYSWSAYLSSQSTQTETSSIVPHKKQIVLQSKQKIDNNKKTIMIVDDEEDIALTYKYFLSSVGYEVITFIDPHSALREYLSNSILYDLLVLDIRMPDINGLQLYQSIKTINPACRAIFVSALDAAKEVASILPGTSPKDIIQKPVKKQQLISAVKTALNYNGVKSATRALLSISFLFVFPLLLL